MVFCEDVYPPKPNPHRYVNDFAEVLTPQQEANLEKVITDFYNQTSNQIAVVTVKSLHGNVASTYATELGHRWGVGQKGKDSGVVLLVKPKYSYSKGEVFIAVGYGLEFAITDAKASRIVDRQLIPNFKKNNYYKGIYEAVKEIINLSKHTYSFTPDNILPTENRRTFQYILLFILLLLPVIYVIYISTGKVSKQFRSQFPAGEYSVETILNQIEILEKENNENLDELKQSVIKYRRLGRKRLLKDSHLIDNKVFCYRLNGRNRRKVFWKYADILLKIILFILLFDAIILSYYFAHQFGIWVFFLSLFVSLCLIYGMLSFLYSIVEITQTVNRSNGKTRAAVSLAFFA